MRIRPEMDRVRSPTSITTEFSAANSWTEEGLPENISENIRGLLLAEDGHVAEVLEGALTHSVLTHLQHRRLRSLSSTTFKNFCLRKMEKYSVTDP
jgi:hypothetical protein